MDGSVRFIRFGTASLGVKRSAPSLGRVARRQLSDTHCSSVRPRVGLPLRTAWVLGSATDVGTPANQGGAHLAVFGRPMLTQRGGQLFGTVPSGPTSLSRLGSPKAASKTGG